MLGTPNQIEWAQQIKAKALAEFDRVAKAFESVAQNQIGQDRENTRAMIEILRDKQAEVMARDQAGYFITEWQELRDQVRKLIVQDPRYPLIKGRQR